MAMLYVSAHWIGAGIVGSMFESLRGAPVLSLVYHHHHHEVDSAGSITCSRRGIADTRAQRQAAVYYARWCDLHTSCATSMPM